MELMSGGQIAGGVVQAYQPPATPATSDSKQKR
jgi:hypothetical protein